jgi:hypothetical protein
MVISLLAAGALSLAHAGCSSAVTCTGDCTAATTGSGGHGGDGGAGGCGGSASNCGGYGGDGENVDYVPDCSCACGVGQPPSLVCNDPAHPNFCAGVAPEPGGPCEIALKTNCGYTDADIAAFGCN